MTTSKTRGIVVRIAKTCDFTRFATFCFAGRLAAFCFAAATAAGLAGCGPAVVAPTAYDVRVRLDPATHRLAGETIVSLRREPDRTVGGGPTALEFALNRALQVESLTADGARIIGHTIHEPPPEKPAASQPATTQPAAGNRSSAATQRAAATQPATAAQPVAATQPEGLAQPPLLVVHRVLLDDMGREASLRFTYAGELVQDVQAGEKRGQIHNFLMAAHIGTEGIYLDAGGGWYPSTFHEPEHPHGELAQYRLTADAVPGMELVAGATFDAEASRQSGKLIWRSSYPLDGLVLVGGPHQIKQRDAEGVQISLHYTPPADEQSRAMMERNTDLFLNAAADYLKRYPPLIGPYPFRKYTIVENFFSSGFAFPEFTLLNKALFQMGQRALGHGFLDHEMLHCWWGNGIYVDPADGNWCEALTSYAANYYGYVLDGDEKGARNQRRNCCMVVSRLKPDEDKPLGQFGRPDGPPREIGYNKGSMVFHMVAGRIGQENFWKAVRRLTRDYTGRYANWQTLQTVFEQESGMKLDRFVREWVRSAGAPRLEVSSAAWRAAEGVLEITIVQSGTNFELVVPLRIVLDDGSATEQTVALDGPTATARLKLAQPARSVVLDPDYNLLRTVAADELIPNVAITKAASKLLIVAPPEPLSKFYQRVIEDFSGESGTKDVLRRTPVDVTAADFAGRSVLILGEAVDAAPVQALLARTPCPIKWEAGGFRIDDVMYDKPGQAVLCTVHHPDAAESAVTVYYGNSEPALGRSDLLGFYRDSLAVFDTTTRQAGGEVVYESRPVARRDFETVHTVEVSR